jgi:uncharacterized repeat protein (TIGR04076 family)
MKMDRQEYLNTWKSLAPIAVTMVDKLGKCNHELGQAFTLKTPYDKPAGMCSALWHVVQLYTWRTVLGFPSWESDDATVYRVHCPSKKGTVWEMKKASV